MPRRRKADENSSLELLLDTMTNAFGGVLFLAILLSVQSKDRSVVTAPQPELDSERTRLESQRDILRMKVSSQTKQQELSESFLVDYADAADILAFEHLQEAKDQIEELLLREQGAAERIAQIQQQESSSTRNLNELSKKREATEDELLRLRAELTSEKEKRTISGRLPRRKLSTKSESALFIKQDRVHQVYKNGQYNSRDILVEEGLRSTTLKPRPGGGVAISNSREFGQKLIRLIDADPRTHHVTVALWDDAFDQFQTIKKHIIAAGFEYRIVMLQEHESVGTGAGVRYTQ